MNTTGETKFEYQGESFSLDEKGLSDAYRTFLRDEKNTKDFNDWHTHYFSKYPDSIAWAVWKGILVEQNGMIFMGNQHRQNHSPSLGAS